MDVPRISINANVKVNEPKPFLARVTVDELRPGKYENKPWQWCFAVKPLKFVVKGQGFPAYVGISAKEIEEGPSEQSQFGLHHAAFKKIFGGAGDLDIGVGALIDQYAWFIRKTHFYPANPDGTQYKTELTIPVCEATAEEIEEAGGDAPAPTSVSLTDIDAQIVLGTLEGKTQAQFAKAALRAKLDPKLTSAIVNGTALAFLVDNGLASVNEDGVLERAA